MRLNLITFSWKTLLITIAVTVVVSFVVDIIRISSYKTYPMRSADEIRTREDEVYFDLVNGVKKIDWSRLGGTLEYIDGQYDCSDFRLVNLLRIIYEFEDRIPQAKKSEIEQTLLHFRYWWDEPGENSMCYWSENHQILFLSAEYLIGQKYPDHVFPNSGLTGRGHMEKARKRILYWLEMRWKYGFAEFYSDVYYKEDIGAMINLIDFAEDEEIVRKTEIIMDLLFYDVAAQSSGIMFASVTGRAYERSRKGGPRSDLGGLTRFFWGNEKGRAGMVFGIVASKKYILPPVLIEIAGDTNTVVIRQSNGLDVPELKYEGYYGTDDRSMMMQWAMEAFTNPEIVRNSISFIRKHNMFSNEAINDFKLLDLSLLRWLHLEPFVVKLINPQSNGVAIQKGNTYTFRTKDYSLYSVQHYHPGTYGDQQHVSGMNIGSAFSIFHTHPALEEGIAHQSPNYWVGYGHVPHVVQDRNVSLAVYRIPAKKGLMEAALLNYTHAYFPKQKFDSVFVMENYAFGKKGNTYGAFICKNKLFFRAGTTDDLIQNGKRTFWITEAGSTDEDGSFQDFYKNIMANQLAFDSTDLVLTYVSHGREYRLVFNGDFKLDGRVVDTRYKRYESPYNTAEKKAKTIYIKAGDKSLHLDFDNMIRRF